jgi:uncharacterized protein YcgI (DUF1989 family)
MTFAEIVALVSTLGKAVSDLVAWRAAAEAKIATLEAQVQSHDAQLKSAPEPGAIQKGT